MANTNSFFIPSSGEVFFSPDTTDLFLRIPVAGVTDKVSDTSFHLTSQDDTPFDQTLTMADDLIPGDEFAELLFTKLPAQGKFSLEIDPGGGKPKYFAFKEKSIADLGAMPTAGTEGAGGKTTESSPGAEPTTSDKQAIARKEQYE